MESVTTCDGSGLVEEKSAPQSLPQPKRTRLKPRQEEKAARAAVANFHARRQPHLRVLDKRKRREVRHDRIVTKRLKKLGPEETMGITEPTWQQPTLKSLK